MPQNSTGEWTCENGNVEIINENSSIATINNLPAGNTILTWTISQTNVCGQNSEEIILTQETPLAPASIPDGDTLCVSGIL